METLDVKKIPPDIVRNLLTEVPDHFETEFLVVGSGPGGSMTAYALAEAGKEVLLVDSGRLCEPAKAPAFSLEELEEKYWNRGQTFSFGNPKILYAMAHCVGGGSEINNGDFILVPEDVFTGWKRDFHLADIRYEELKSHFNFCAAKLKAKYDTAEGPMAKKFRKGAEALGWDLCKVPRCFKPTEAESVTMTKSFLPEAMRQGCRILAPATVRKLHRTGGKWVVMAETQGQTVEISCQTLFLCAGPVQTASVLLASGIKRNVGRSLQFQPMLKITAKFPEEINYEGMGIPSLQSKQFAPKVTLGCSVSTLPYIALNLLPFLKDHKQFQAEWKHYANFNSWIVPTAVSTIKKFPFLQEPLLWTHLTDEDISTLHMSMEKLMRLLLEAGAEELTPSISDQRFQIRLPAQLQKLPVRIPRNRLQLTAVHLSSSCPMGEDPKKCAVDSFGKVHETENLYVSDASILCRAPSVNLQGSIMSFARRNAFHCLGK